MNKIQTTSKNNKKYKRRSCNVNRQRHLFLNYSTHTVISTRAAQKSKEDRVQVISQVNFYSRLNSEHAGQEYIIVSCVREK